MKNKKKKCYFCGMEIKRFEQQVKWFMASHRMVEEGGRVLVALSGGADSVALLRVLRALGFDCVAAHGNFHLRGDESMRDEDFVRGLCARLNVPLQVRHFDVPAYRSEYGASVEMACRALRYEWFGELLDGDNCNVLAVAHHRDDNVEGFFLNALRGTGLAGLAGMRAVRGRVVRPLLCVCRDDIHDYLRALGQDFVTDSSNMQNDYLRNRLRNVVLPVLDREFPRSGERIADTMTRVAEGRDLYFDMVRHFEKLSRLDAPQGTRRYSLTVLRRLPHHEALLYEIIRPDGFNRAQCRDILNANPGAVFLSSTKTLYVGRDYVDIQDAKTINDVPIFIDFLDAQSLPDWLSVEPARLPFAPQMVDGRDSVALHGDVLKCRQVVLRRWRHGDRLSPYGMRGTKLVSDLFADAKLGELEKNAAWLLEADGSVLWVLGYRASMHYAVPEKSTDYLLLRYRAR